MAEIDDGNKKSFASKQFTAPSQTSHCVTVTVPAMLLNAAINSFQDLWIFLLISS